MSDDSDTGIPKKRTRKVRYVEDSPQNSSGDDSPIGSSSSRRKKRLVIEDDSDSDSGSSIEPGVSRWKKNVRRVVESDPADSDSSGSVIVKKPRRPGRVVSSESEDDEDDTDHGFEESSSSQWESDFSQDGDDARDTATVAENGTKQAELNASTSSKIQDTGVDSDSSDGQSDRCPICLISLRSQEIGIPESCDHMFCSECIQEWSKNVNTCPVDRQEYRLILVRSNVNGNICRRIPVEPPDPQLLQQQQQNDDMEEIIEDPTFCENCGSSDREERMLLCDGCDLGYHLECLVPPLQDIPHGSWYCSDCGAPDDTEDEVIDLVELQLLYDEAGPLVRPGLRPRASSSTRLVPRTRHSERVRRRIQNNRNSNNSTNNRRNREEQQVATAVPGNSSRVSSTTTTTTTTNNTNQATAQPVRRKKTKKKRKQRRTRYKITYEIDELTGETVTVKKRIKSRRRKRTRTAGGRRTGRRSENSVASARPKSVKKRLAQQLGMCAPRVSVPQNVPDLRVPANTTVLGGLGLQRHQAGIPALHLFGRRHELDYFSPSSDEEIGNSDGVLVRRRAPNHSDVSIFRRAARAKSIMAPSLDLPSSSSSSLVNNSVSSTTDLLGSILDSQAKFHSRNTIFSLDSNGKVTMEKRATGEDRLDVNSSSNANQSVRRKPASSSQQAAGNSSGGAQQNNRDSVPSSSNRGDYHQTSSSMGYSTSSSATMPSSTVEPGSSGGFPGPSGSSGLPYGVQDYTQKTLNAAYQDNRRDRRRPLLRTPHDPPAMDEMEEREDSAYEPYDPLNPGSSRSNSPSYDNNDGGGAGDESDIDIYSDIETSAVSTSNKDESDMMTHHHHHHQQQQPHHGHMLPRPPSPPEMLMMMMSPSMMTMTSSSSQNDLSLNNNGGGAGSNDDEHDSDDEPDMVIDTEKMTPQNENEDDACGVKEETAVSSTVDSSNIPAGEASHAENAPNVTSTLELQSEAVQSSTNRTYGAGTKPSSGNDMDDDDSEDECPNFSIYSKESITMAKNTDISLESVTNNHPPNEVPSVDQEMAHQEETAPLANSDQQQLEQEQKPDDQVEPQQSNPVDDNDSAQIGVVSSSPSVVPTPADAPPETTFRQDCVERDSSVVHSTPTTSSDLNATNNDEAPQPDGKKKPSSTPSTTGKKKPIFGGVSSGLYSDSEDETIVKKDLMSPTKKKTPSAAFAISDIRNMTEDISEEEERSYTPCLDERAPGGGAAAAGVPPAGGLEGLDTEMISDEERNEFDESHDLKTASDAGDALEINAKESELDFTRPEDYEEGEIVDKQQKDGKTPENSNNADKDSDSGADDKTDKAAATAKSNDDKEKDDGHGSDKDKDTSGATVNTSSNSHNKEQEDEDKDKDPSSFKKLSRSNKERNYRDKEREERSRSKSPEHKTGGSGGKNATGNNTGSTSKKKREKRKEIKRYDVRALIAEKPRRLKDQFGRDIRRTSSRTRSRSLTPPPRRSASRGRRSLSRSRRSVSRDRPPVSSRIRRTLSRGRRSVSRQAPRRSSMTPPPPLKRRSVSRGRNNARSRSRTPRDRSRSRDWDGTAVASAPLAASSRSSRKKQRNNRSSPARARNNKSLSRSFTPPERPERSKRSRSKQRKRKRSASRSKNRRRKSRDRSKNKKKQRSRSRHRSRSFTPVTAPPPSSKRRTNKDWPQAQHVQQQQRGHSREWTPSMSRSRTPELQQQQQRLTPSWTPPRLLESAVQQPRNNLTVILPNQNAVAAASSKKKKDKKRRAEKRAKENEGNVNSAGGRQKKRRRVDRTPPPSKEVFASGDNILVSVSFNKENETRDVVSTKRKGARDIAEDLREAARKKREKRRKEQQLRNRSRADLSGIKPVAIIDLERSPFKELTPSPKDVIVLSDSETEERIMENELHRHDLASPIEERDDLQQNLCDSSQQVASPELSQSYLTSGPKTPPEPQIKFTLLSKPSQIRAISNPLHDPDDIEPEEEEDLEENNAQQNLMMSDQRGGMMDVGGVLLQHKGPNTPPEPPNSPPSSPDAYDPFEPTKSRSPTPEPQHQQQSLELQQNNNSVLINGSGGSGNNALTLEDGGPPPTENIMSAMSNLMGEILESTAAIVGHKTPPDGAAVIKSLTPPLLDVQPADSQSSIHATPETNLTKSPERTVGSAVPTTASTPASALLTTTQNTNSSSTTTTPSKPTAQTTIPFSSVAAAAASTLASTSSSTAAGGGAAPSTSSIVITSTPIMASNSSNPSTTTSAQQQALAGTPTSSKINILNTTVIAAPSSLPQRIVLPSSAAVKASPVKISPNKSAAGAAAGAGGGAGIKSTTLVKPMVSTKANTATKVMRKSNTGQSNNRNQQQQQQQNNNSTTAVDIINLLDASLNLDSPYSPGSSDYEDLFEPPTESVPPQKTVSNKSSAQQNNSTSTNNKSTSKSPAKAAAATQQQQQQQNAFDALFGSPFNKLKGSAGATKNDAKTGTATKMNKKPVAASAGGAAGGGNKGKGSKQIGVKIDEDNLRILDDLPNSAVEMQVKDKFLKKLNRQERVVEEVKLVLKPHYNKKHVTKEEYKDILRRAVPKICHNKSGEINPTKIKNLVEAYVKKVRHNKKVTSSSSVNPQKT